MSGKEITSSLFQQASQEALGFRPEAGGQKPQAADAGPTACRLQPTASHIIRVAVESSGADAEFDYLTPEGLWPIRVGQRVEVPFGKSNKLEAGFCVWADVPAGESFVGKEKGRQLKSVARVLDEEPLLGDQLMELATWIGDYYVC